MTRFHTGNTAATAATATMTMTTAAAMIAETSEKLTTIRLYHISRRFFKENHRIRRNNADSLAQAAHIRLQLSL